jgi:L,D-transpeptidase-like protein
MTSSSCLDRLFPPPPIPLPLMAPRVLPHTRRGLADTHSLPGKVIAPGPQNPIGTRWIGLNQKGYGIHGTDQPSSIGYAKSHGCIRLRNADVERLFERVRTGDVVELHAERTPELDQLFTSSY